MFVYVRVKLIKGCPFLGTINFGRSHAWTYVRTIKFKYRNYVRWQWDRWDQYFREVFPGGPHAYTDNLVEKESYFRLESFVLLSIVNEYPVEIYFVLVLIITSEISHTHTHTHTHTRARARARARLLIKAIFAEYRVYCSPHCL